MYDTIVILIKKHLLLNLSINFDNGQTLKCVNI